MKAYSDLEQIQQSIGCMAKLAGHHGSQETWPSGDEWYALLHLVETRLEQVLDEMEEVTAPSAARARRAANEA